MSDTTDRRSFMMWADFKATPAARITAACAAFRGRWGTPALVLVAAGEGADVAGVEVREAKAGEGVVRPGVVWVRGGAL
jgi:hypothetical protein